LRKGPKVSTDLSTSMNLRLLIHYIGDLHQPLHATSRMTEAHPDGDLGGNLFKLDKHGEFDELHAVWDAMVFWHDNDFPEPLSEEHWKEMGEISSYLRTEYPKESENWYGKPEDWATESHEIAVEFVYPEVQEGSWPSDAYIAKGQKIAQKRVAQAGFRLAQTLVELFADQNAFL